MLPGEYQRGVIYTVDPRILAPLTPGEEYRVVASTRFLIAEDAAFTKFGSKFWYDEFYNDFDMRTDRRQPSVLIVSYGEYVPSQMTSTSTALSHAPRIVRDRTSMS